MSSIDKIIGKILSGNSDNNIDFSDLRKFMSRFEFLERIKGSHHIYTKTGIPEIINIQPIGNLAKGYQVKQIRNLFLKHNLFKNNG